MIPVFSIVGRNSNVGKTTVTCNVIKELKFRGYRVAFTSGSWHCYDIFPKKVCKNRKNVYGTQFKWYNNVNRQCRHNNYRRL